MLGLNLDRAALTVLAFLISVPVFAEVDEALLASGWEEVTFDGKIANRFSANGADAIAVESEGSVSLLQRPLDVDLEATPLLAWNWQVMAAAPPTDLAVRGEDDRSLALYIAFPFVPEEAGVMERMKRAVIESTVGKDAPGRVLVYVWGGKGARGERVPSPHLGKAGAMIILRPAKTPLGEAFDETVDIAADYRDAFGSEPPAPLSLAIGADTDDTKSMAKGLITGLEFTDETNAF